MKKIFLSFIFIIVCSCMLHAQSLMISATVSSAKPLQQITITGAKGSTIKVFDGKGKQYAAMLIKPFVSFIVGGALGTHTIRMYDAANKIIDSTLFEVDAQTNIDDGGYYKNMFQLFHNGMHADADAPTGVYPITWNGKTYNVIVPWVLDNFQTMKGMKYFIPNGRELVDIMRQSQREDGMIYSFIQYMPNADYWLTRDKFSGYSKKIGDKIFVRQPTENHPEYLYVNTIYDCWKAEGDDAWMKQNLSSAARALDYAPNDAARWSKRFQLLKRAYTIDSWDFAVEDEYMPDIGITNSMIIDPVKTKFGVFFGDNTGYITACYQLAEMLDFTGDAASAAKYKRRGDEIKKRLDALAWNGKFFTHFIDEDSSVHRHLGVDEKSQIAQSNAYSINRDITHEQSKAIIETYLDLKNHLPVGSPGEWYAIYPPFQKGFGAHDEVWQYMNGGVGGHVAGELARGAYNNGYENYATDILNRLFELGKKYDNKIWFAYTGSIPPPPSPPVYKPLDLSAYANMDIANTTQSEAIPWMNAKRSGDDLQNMPVGAQTLAGIDFLITDPAKNNRKTVVAVSQQKDFPSTVEIKVNDTAACIYLLHTSSKPASENIVGAVKILYDDGSTQLQYISMEKHLTYWWFSQLQTDYSGIAWYGKNDVSEGVGVSWCAIDNPEPQKKISKIILQSAEGNVIYTVLGITLSNKKHYVPVKASSYGGPDNWAAATAMTALVQGLAGVNDAPHSEAFSHPMLSPRWINTASDTVAATIRYAASQGYVSYRFIHSKTKKQIQVTATGSGNAISYHILLPEKINVIKSVTVNNKSVAFTITKIEQSAYADFSVSNDGVKNIVINY